MFIMLLLLGSCGQNNSVETAGAASDPEFVEIPAGWYEVGGNGHPVNPKRKVYLESYRISSVEVTNREWERFIDATGYMTVAEKRHNARTFYPGLGEFQWVEDSSANWRYPFGRKAGGVESKPDHPVTCIAYTDVQKYCEWAGVRLPTLDEWEVACRAGTQGRWFFGNHQKINRYANIWQNANHAELTIKEDFLYTSPVASYEPNAWGLYDMYGNVFEFCSDKPEYYDKKPKAVCARGGSWWCSRNACNFFNSVDIGSVSPVASFSNQGFRVVRVR